MRHNYGFSNSVKNPYLKTSPSSFYKEKLENALELCSTETQEFFNSLVDEFDNYQAKQLLDRLEEESIYAGTSSDWGFPEICFLTVEEVRDHLEAMKDPYSNDENCVLDECLDSGMKEIPFSAIEDLKAALIAKLEP